jgi:hypothetical protein
MSWMINERQFLVCHALNQFFGMRQRFGVNENVANRQSRSAIMINEISGERIELTHL